MVGFEASGAAVTAQGLGMKFAFFTFTLPPTVDARTADPKAFAGFAMRCTSFHGCKDPDPEIKRQHFLHAFRPPLTQTI